MVRHNDYFGFGRKKSIIFAVIFLTCWIFGLITRFKEKKYLACLVRLIFGFNILWLIDILTIIKYNSILRLLNR